jgi:hypothetical protein
LEDRAERERDAERGYTKEQNSNLAAFTSTLFQISSDGCNRLVVQLENLNRVERNLISKKNGSGFIVPPLYGEAEPSDEVLDSIALQISRRIGPWARTDENANGLNELAKFGPCETKILGLLALNNVQRRLIRRGLWRRAGAVQ